MAKVLFWKGSVDGSSHYRCVLPAKALEWRGHHVEYGTHFLDHQFKVDAVVASRVAKPEGHDRIEWIRKNSPDTKIFVDLDDDYFHIDNESQGAKAFWDPEMVAGLQKSLDMVDGVTAVSARLADSLQQRTSTPVHVVENYLHAGILAFTRDYDPEQLTIGWAGSENTASWLPMIKDAVNSAVAGRFGPKPYIKFIGVPYQMAFQMGFRWRKGEGTIINWIPQFDPYLQALSTVDILLAPYRHTTFTAAKFPTKGLESGFLGIPIIASRIPPYQDWVTHGVNGYLVPNNRPDQWGTYLRELLNDASLRRQMALKNTSRASRNLLQGSGASTVWERTLGLVTNGNVAV